MVFSRWTILLYLHKRSLLRWFLWFVPPNTPSLLCWLSSSLLPFQETVVLATLSPPILKCIVTISRSEFSLENLSPVHQTYWPPHSHFLDFSNSTDPRVNYSHVLQHFLVMLNDSWAAPGLHEGSLDLVLSLPFSLWPPLLSSCHLLWVHKTCSQAVCLERYPVTVCPRSARHICLFCPHLPFFPLFSAPLM